MVGILFGDACLCLTETRLGCGLCDCQFYTQCSSLSHPDIPVFVTRVVQCTVEQPSTAQYSLLRQRQAQISWSVSRAEQPDTSLDTDPRQPAPPLNTSLAFLDSDPPTKMGLKTGKLTGEEELEMMIGTHMSTPRSGSWFLLCQLFSSHLSHIWSSTSTPRLGLACTLKL